MIHRNIIRCCTLLSRVQQKNALVKPFARNSHVVSYRSGPPPHSKATAIGAEFIGALMWWWVLWHIWHEPGHITGEFPYPDVSAWTNSELGIPK